MTAEERRVIEALQAHAGGLIVTEQDVRDAQLQLRETLDGPHPGTAWPLGALAAAAVVALIVGFLAFQKLGVDSESAPPAHQRTADPDADFLTGSAPTPELLEGVWWLEGAELLMRFTAPDRIAFDDGGLLFAQPGVEGRYTVAGSTISVSVTGGAASCGGQDFAMRASLPQDGQLRLVYTDPPARNCHQDENERWTLQQVLPTSAELAGRKPPRDGSWERALGDSEFHGVWLAQGGSHALSLLPDGSYSVTGQAAELDRGRWSYRNETLRLESELSGGCARPGLVVLGDVRLKYVGFSTDLRGAVTENDCEAPWAATTWWQLSP